MDARVVQQSSDLAAVELTVREVGDTALELSNPLGISAVFAQFEPPKGAPAAAREAYAASAWRVTKIGQAAITVARNEGVAYPQGPQAVLWLRRDMQPPTARPKKSAPTRTAAPAGHGRRVAAQRRTPPPRKDTE